MIELPHVLPFEIREIGLEFVDRREADVVTMNAATLLFGLHLMTEFRAEMGGAPFPGLCGDDVARENLIAERFEDWYAQTGGTWEEFERSGGTFVRQIDRDPSRPWASLIALDSVTGDPVGTLGIHNVDEDGGAMLIPGLGAHLGRSRERVWASVALHLLRSELELADGSSLDLQAVVIPDERPEFAIDRDAPGGMAEYFDELEAGGARLIPSSIQAGAIARVELEP